MWSEPSEDEYGKVVAFSSRARVWGEYSTIHSRLRLFFSFFFSGDQVAHTNSTLKARISPQWLSDGRREYFKWAIIVHFARGYSTGV